jgi:hypothetical protein
MAVALGTTARLIRPEGPSMAVMTMLPLSLVPTFIVPLLFIFHLICIVQAKRWKSRPHVEAGESTYELTSERPRPVAQ